MAEVEYRPANTDFADTFFNAAGNAQSLMARAQQMRMAREEYEFRKRQAEVLMPAMQAKAQADVVQAQATLQNFTQQQGLRRKFGEAAPQAQREFEDAMQLSDWGEQAKQLSLLHQKYSWMEMLPEGKPFVEAIGARQVQANQSYDLNARLEIQRLNAEEATRRALETTQMRTTSSEKIAGAKNETTMAVEQSKNERSMRNNDPEALNTKAAQLEQLAQEEDDPVQQQVLLTSAKQYRDRAVRVTKPVESGMPNFAALLGGGQTAAAPAAPAAQPTSAAAPAQSDNVKLPVNLNY